MISNMRYVIDGYNLLFCHYGTEGELESSREDLIEKLIEWSNETGIEMTVLFDASKTVDPSTRGHRGNLEIIYTAPGEIADDYIVELMGSVKKGDQVTVVTDDRRLAWRSQKAPIQTIGGKAFLNTMKKKTSSPKRESEKLSQQFRTSDDERWLEEFEKRVEEG